MTYRVYSGPRGSQMPPPLQRDHALYKEFNALDEALRWAQHVNSHGRVALLIEGDDGTYLTRNDIAETLTHGESKLEAGIQEDKGERTIKGPGVH